MKVVIFCGGRGTRLNEETENTPKPLINLADKKPIIWHIMSGYLERGFNDFILCLGYKGELFPQLLSKYEQFNIKYLETGIKSGTAERLRCVKDFVGDNFFVTYGDGISNIDIKSSYNYHISHGKIGTVSAVRPLIRFGKLEINGNSVKSFRKYESPKEGWIDGGFFVFTKDIFNYLEDIDKTSMFEGSPLEHLSSDGELNAYKHEGYWQCIDTYRDLVKVNKDLKIKEKLWI